jgi:hypothetical protein
MEFMNENNTLDVPKLIEEVITNTTGVKNTYSDIIKGEYDWRDQFKPDDVISNGRKL